MNIKEYSSSNRAAGSADAHGRERSAHARGDSNCTRGGDPRADFATVGTSPGAYGCRDAARAGDRIPGPISRSRGTRSACVIFYPNRRIYAYIVTRTERSNDDPIPLGRTRYWGILRHWASNG